MLVAAFQSCVWFYGVPIICRKYWDSIFGSMTPLAAEAVLTTSTLIACILIGNILMLPIYYLNHPFFEQFKINPDRPWPWLDEREDNRRAFWALTKRSVKITAVNLFILAPILSLSKIWLCEMISFNNPSSFKTDDENWPSLVKNFRDVVLMSILHELGFYITHRLMHSYSWLYKYHKVHHEYKSNTTLASLHDHPVDFVLSLGVPGLLAIALVGPHSCSTFQWLLWTMYTNLDDHLGYSFPWSPVRWFPFSAATSEHEFHHAKNLGCFGSKLSIFNTLLGGYDSYYIHIGKGKDDSKRN